MKLAWSLGVATALVLHAAFVLFGGILFPEAMESHDAVQAVELLSELETEQEEQEPEPPQTQEPAPDEEMEAPAEAPPDASEILRDLEVAPVIDAPALAAVSLSALEAALGGQGAAGDFNDALSLESGGRLGGSGRVAALERELEQAFSMAELDQAPRVVFQAAASYPAQMRGKKVEGVVSVIFVVDADGKVLKPQAESSSHVVFERPAVDAVAKWKFEPGLRAGERVPTKMRVSVRFKEKA